MFKFNCKFGAFVYFAMYIYFSPERFGLCLHHKQPHSFALCIIRVKAFIKPEYMITSSTKVNANSIILKRKNYFIIGQKTFDLDNSCKVFLSEFNTIGNEIVKYTLKVAFQCRHSANEREITVHRYCLLIQHITKA